MGRRQSREVRVTMSSQIPNPAESKSLSSNEEPVKEAIHHLEEAERDLEHAHADQRHAEEEIRAAERELRDAQENRPKEIHFFLDGEPEVTDRHELTPNQIIAEYGGKDPATYYLIQIQGGHEVNNYKDNGNTIIQMKNGTHYQMISTGPTPVSDGRPKTGVAAFVDGLIAMGYEPELVSDAQDHVMFDFVVPLGKYTGQTVKLGFIVPVDFPLSIPSGPHVSPSILPLKAEAGPHPSHGVHENRFTSDGTDWQYWSRPFNEWNQRKKTVEAYMGHILRLWETQ